MEMPHKVEPAWIAIRCFALSRKLAGSRYETISDPPLAMAEWVLGHGDQSLALQALSIAVEHRTVGAGTAMVLQLAEDAYRFATTFQAEPSGQPAAPVQMPRRKGRRTASATRSATKD